MQIKARFFVSILTLDDEQGHNVRLAHTRNEYKLIKHSGR